MKKIILILLLFISCTPESTTFSEETLLKNLPDSFFTQKNTIHSINKSDTFINPYNKFPNTEYSKFHLKKHAEKYQDFFNVSINLSIDNKITLEGQEVLNKELLSFTQEYIEFAAEGKPTMIHLNFDENNTLKNYVSFINYTKQLKDKNIHFNSNVFIYNIKLLPDCNCSL